MRRLLLTAILLSISLNAFCLDGTTMSLAQAQELFRNGNASYQQQKFEEARASYLQAAEAGVQSPELYYNLGNACARLNHTGEAVLYLSRARELDPRDPDVLANLRRVAPPSVSGSLSTAHPVRWLETRLSLREWIATFLVLFTLLGSAVGFYLSLRRPRPAILRIALWAGATATAVVGLVAGHVHYKAHYVQFAVLSKANLSVRSGPADTFAQVDVMPEGEIVKRLSTVDGDWSQVQLADGRKGYLPPGALLLL